MSNTQPLKYTEIPSIPRYLAVEDFHKVVPWDMYPEYIQSVLTNVEDKLNPTLRIIFHPEVIEGVQNELIIPTAMLNSQIAEVETPLFLFEDSTRKSGTKKYPYFNGVNNTDVRVLNMNQMLYMFIQHRLAYFKRVLQKGKKLYLDLLRNKDLKELKSCIEYQKPISFNALKKIENTYVIINNKVHNVVKDYVIGERIRTNGFSEADWQLVVRDLFPFVRPTSESSFNEKCKLVLSPDKKPIYRGPAYSFNEEGATTIFPFKANLIARLKTHITGDGIELANPDKSCFKHDLIFENGQTKLLDNTIKYALTIFHPMDFESKRFVAGELEASESIAKTLVKLQQHVQVFCEEPEHISVTEGATYYPKGKPFDLSTKTYTDPLNERVIDNKIYGVESFTVKYIKSLSNNIVRITIDKTMRAGNARITSKTGLKGVTNITGKDRHVYFAPVGKTIEDLQDKSIRDTIFSMRTRKLKTSHHNYEFLSKTNGDLEQINSVSYKTVNPNVLKEEGWSEHKVDIVTGMNAVKAKTNTIILAQALLAVHLGYYTPVDKGKNGIYKGILDASDEDEINKASESLPDFIYLDENNVPNKCYVGLVPINFTELGKTYAKFKPQSFSFESGNVIKSVHKPLFDHIFSNYLEEDKKSVCLELYEILEDFNGKLGYKNDLPVLKLADIRKHIKPTDLFLTSSTRDIIDSILFNNEFNPKGFIIDVRALAKKADSNFKTQLIRIPSASTLRYFMSVRNDGTYMYDPFLRTLSRIFMPLLGYRNLRDLDEGDTTKNKDFVPYYYLFSRKNSVASEQYQTHLELYYSMLKGTVYSSSDSSKQLTQSLIKPQIPGFSLKQVVKSIVPDGVIVLLDEHIHKRTFRQAGKSDLLDQDSNYNLVLDIAIMAKTNEERIEIKDDLLEVLDSVPLLLVNRNPVLWKSQQLVRNFYGYREFKAYLNVIHNINLDDMLSSSFNRDVVFMSPRTALIQKSDVDGDLSVNFVLNEEGQKLLAEFKEKSLNICDEEKQWIEDYIKGEYETNTDLMLDWHTKVDKDGKPLQFKYKVYQIPVVFDMNGNKHIKTYCQYLINAGIAKSNVG